MRATAMPVSLCGPLGSLRDTEQTEDRRAVQMALWTGAIAASPADKMRVVMADLQ